MQPTGQHPAISGLSVRSAFGFREPENMGHVIRPRGLVLAPQGRLERSPGKDAPITRKVTEDDAFSVSGKNDIVLANDITTPYDAEPDAAAWPWSGNSVPRPDFDIFKPPASAISSSLAQHERSSRRRIDLVPVMGLDDLDVKVLIEGCRDLPGYLDKQVDPKAHVAGPDDRCMKRGSRDSLEITFGQTGGSDDVNRARLGREFRMHDC